MARPLLVAQHMFKILLTNVETKNIRVMIYVLQYTLCAFFSDFSFCNSEMILI